MSFSKLVKPAAPFLALCGNIGRPESPKTQKFLHYCSTNWDKVYWVPGPHELSNTIKGTMTYTEKTIQALQLCKDFRNVQLMNSNEAVFHEHKIVLLGTPLWSELHTLPKGQPEFNSMYSSVDESGPVPLTLAQRNALHKDDSFYLKERSLTWSIVHHDMLLVYLTHTLPSTHLLTMHHNSRVWSRVSMDVTQMRPYNQFPIRAWIGGATGSCKKVNLGPDSEDQMEAAVNSLYEYPFSIGSENPRYDPECVLEIERKKPKGPWKMFPENLVLPPILSSLLRPSISLGHA